jgi:hypothetical protein
MGVSGWLMREPAPIRNFAGLGQCSGGSVQKPFREKAKWEGNLDGRQPLHFISVTPQQLQLRAAEIAVAKVALDTETIRDWYKRASVPQ